MIKKKVMEWWITMMEIFIKESGKMEVNAEKDVWYIIMGIFTRDNGKIVAAKVSEFLSGLMETFTKVSLNMVKRMVSVFTRTYLEEYIKGSIIGNPDSKMLKIYVKCFILRKVTHKARISSMKFKNMPNNIGKRASK